MTESDESTGTPWKSESMSPCSRPTTWDDGGRCQWRHKGSEGCFVSDQRRGTCQLGCGTVTLLKKGEEESSEEHWWTSRTAKPAVRKLDKGKQYSADKKKDSRLIPWVDAVRHEQLIWNKLLKNQIHATYCSNTSCRYSLTCFRWSMGWFVACFCVLRAI